MLPEMAKGIRNEGCAKNSKKGVVMYDRLNQELTERFDKFNDPASVIKDIIQEIDEEQSRKDVPLEYSSPEEIEWNDQKGWWEI